MPSQNDNDIKQDSFEIDFTDLKPKSFELAKNDKGRVYMLNLIPCIKVIDNRPIKANDSSFGFSKWSLVDSMVIFNADFY